MLQFFEVIVEVVEVIILEDDAQPLLICIYLSLEIGGELAQKKVDEIVEFAIFFQH